MALKRWSRKQNQDEAQRLVEQLIHEPKVLVYLPLAPGRLTYQQSAVIMERGLLGYSTRS
jgi:hypothetical protein